MSNDLRTRLKDACRAHNARRWEIAQLLLQVDEGAHFKAWGYRSMGAYARGDLGMTSSELMRYLVAARHWKSETPAQRALMEKRSPQTVYDRLPSDHRRVRRPSMRRLGEQNGNAGAEAPTPTGAFVDTICNATTLIGRGVPNAPAAHEWMARLRAAIEAYDERRDGGEDPLCLRRRRIRESACDGERGGAAAP